MPSPLPACSDALVLWEIRCWDNTVKAASGLPGTCFSSLSWLWHGDSAKLSGSGSLQGCCSGLYREPASGPTVQATVLLSRGRVWLSA